MVAQNWTEVVVASLQGLWAGMVGVLPSLIGALIIIIIGLIVAYVLGTLVVEKILEALKLDSLLAKLGLTPYFERGGLRLRGARFVGQIVYWFVTIAFLLAASDVLGLFAFSSFLRDVLFYIPNVAMAVLIMLAAVVLANFVRKIASASVMSAKLHAAHFLGSLAWWAITVFGFLTALVELNVAVSVINTVITGFVAMLALAGGLAFGLGGKDYAATLINRLRETTGSR
ncbi:MAG TPA: hypothetical protein VMV71_03075 [Candidatus Paceibacterota bacterium]|nr:hypothetical protein [Candidatus Paceibacterota bacterium]